MSLRPHQKALAVLGGVAPLFVAIALIFAFQGCPSATTHVKGDDAVIAASVQAEKVLFNSADTLFGIEKDHGAAMDAIAPGTHDFADRMRDDVNRTLKILRTFTQLYRETTVGPKPDLPTVTAKANALSTQIEARLILLAGAK